MSNEAKNLSIRGNMMGGRDQILSMPRAAAYRLTSHNVAAGGVNTPIQMATIEYDTDGMLNLSTATLASRVTCRTDGVYAFSATILWPVPAFANEYREILFLKNGAGWSALNFYPPLSGKVHQHITAQIPMVAGDYVEVAAQHNSASGTLALLGNDFSTRDLSIQACLIST